MTSGLRPQRDDRRLRVGVDVRCLAGGELRGFARYTLELLQALARRPALDLVALTDSPVPFTLPVPLRHYTGRREVVREQVALALAVSRERLDVLLAPANRGLPWAAPCATVLTLHDAVEWDPHLVSPPTGKSRARLAYASVLSLASADFVLTVSEASASTISERLAVAPQRLRVVHEAAPARFSVDPGPGATDLLRTRLGVQAGFVLYLGGFDKKKDVSTLLRAVARAAEIDDGVELVVAGAPGAERAGLENLAESLGIGRRVRWVGFVEEEDLPALYRAASCFVFPAVAEGFGLPVIEAMSCETPVVVARAASLPEVVGDAGLMFEPGDVVGLSESILTVTRASDAERRAMSERVRSRAASFSWGNTAAATEMVMREAVALPNRLRWSRRVAELRYWRQRLPPRNPEPLGGR